MIPRDNPNTLADQAAEASEKGDFENAAKLYEAAAGASLGAKRAERYQACADECRRKLAPKAK